jgi:hypothetical protein
MRLIRSVSFLFAFLIYSIVDLEFDKESGALKKTKCVTETEVV